MLYFIWEQDRALELSSSLGYRWLGAEQRRFTVSWCSPALQPNWASLEVPADIQSRAFADALQRRNHPRHGPVSSQWGCARAQRERVGTRPLPALWASAGSVPPIDLREDSHAWTRVREPQRGSSPGAQSLTFSWRRREPRVQIRQRVETVLRMCKRRRSFTL